MSEIRLTKEQLELLTASGGTAVLTDEQGHPVGYVSPPLSAAEIRELEQRADSDGPWYTTAEVLEHLELLATR